MKIFFSLFGVGGGGVEERKFKEKVEFKKIMQIFNNASLVNLYIA